MRSYTLLFLLGAFIFISCNEDNDMEDATGSLEINYQLVYEGEPLLMNKTLDYPHQLDINFSRVNMYLSDFFLGDEKLVDITFLDFTISNSSEGGAKSGLLLNMNEVPTGEYQTLSMGVGLPEDVNASQPSDYESGHPLAKTSEYWAGWDSYIFAKYEGKIDLDKDGVLETGFSFHTGSDEVYRELEFDTPISINSNETTEITILLDAKELFRLDNTSYIDLSEIQGTHNQGDVDVMGEISDNYSSAFRIQ